MKQYRRLNKDDAIILFVDHQSGLFSLVQDFAPEAFITSVTALAHTAKLFKLPTVLTTSFEQGPNGPIIPELKQLFPDAPYIARPGEINAWDNPDFVAAIKKTGRKQLIIAGIVTEVCVAFPTLSAIEAGYEVFVATDACGTFNEAARYAAWDRMVHAGAQLMNWFSISGELQRDWRNDVEGYADLLTKFLPSYTQVMTSFKATKK
jgi:nicotinamidase-related amidase